MSASPLPIVPPSKNRQLTNTTTKKKKSIAPHLLPPFPLSSTQNVDKQPSYEADSVPSNFAEAFATVAKILESRRKILVLSGAGTSVSCGIPDFRSKGKGLYATLNFGELGLTCPEDLFDWEFFQSDPVPFYKFARHLYFPLGGTKRVEPSDSHRFLALLEQRKQLLRVYTQNIDGLEERAGVSSKHMVYAHGSLEWATCCKCKRRVPSSEIEAYVKKGVVARCREPVVSKSSSKAKQQASSAVMTTQRSTRSTISRTRVKRKRSCRSEDLMIDNNVCGGVLKPGVTFFGEVLQDKVRRCLETDRDKADALIVIGTSLSVAPMSKVIEYLPARIPRFLINRTIVHPKHKASADEEDDDVDNEEPDFRDGYVFDAYMLGFCDEITRTLVKQLKDKTAPVRSDVTLVSSLIDRSMNESEEEDYEKEQDMLSEFRQQDWTSSNLPHDRLLLFPGAITATHDEEQEVKYQETVQCDGCGKEITKGRIRKCVQCFDYDLCAKCYPKLFKVHFGGKHRFTIECSK